MSAAVSPAVLAASRILWNFHLVYDKLSRADLIVGLGSYDLRVADHCVDLLNQGLASQILFTGKSGNWTGGLYKTSEAEAFAERAMELGVSAQAILIEPEATNIGENIRYAHNMAGNAVKRIIIVTKPQTQRRAFATVRAQWPDVEAMVTAPPTPFDEQPIPAYPMENFINEMVGDVKRVIDYPAKGYQIPQHIPAHVADAFDFLVKAGYDNHL
ncbi:YdcF family protein [Phyllobacterium sp. SB3]|uniref:YdcF family protein n=1 Tax=Phyllobacterium sp. SB3 TaxID=3156073 RepID=UPI0032AF19DF